MQSNFFDLENRYDLLDEIGDRLLRLDAVIDWELFREVLKGLDKVGRKSAAGRKPFDRVLMFKELVLQRLYNLADERLAYKIGDRLSFMRFLGLELSGKVPDARTLWAFREQLVALNLVEPLFDRLPQALREAGPEMKSGQMWVPMRACMIRKCWARCCVRPTTAALWRMPTVPIARSRLEPISRRAR